ncbi:MAG: aminotransferase class I/II-fold pyridoxal phosphate-dependent enzyme [Acidobacteria bacterium]|nr:aminotransferase class I/II-fold pyridoxal phosphate-dependent enzyme [Acidobacteriota bacterium]MYJ05067.1 aminotransferase class I/II-fold pyridoxal phosphate-dependent enzyme [Acidobacteriota bacterium]
MLLSAPVTIEPFALERFQSVYEHQVDINLSESGVEPLRLEDLLPADELERLLREPLGYTQTNGSAELRELVAAEYAGASVDSVLITTGCAEANFLTCWKLVEPGDEVVVLHPNYLQTHLLAHAHGARVRPWRLRLTGGGAARWAPALDELRDLVTERTRLIALCNPNNPTGARLTGEEIDAVCTVAARHGAWVLSDEVYRGAERDGVLTASVWGRYDRLVVTSGLSKVYGLPGLRIGWVVAPPALCEELWARRDFTTIAPAALSDRLARLALAPDMSARLRARAQQRVAEHYAVVREWIAGTGAGLAHVPPEAGAIAFLGYPHAVGSEELATTLRETAGVLVAPGAYFGLDGYLRIGFGEAEAPLRIGLGRLEHLFSGLPQPA